MKRTRHVLVLLITCMTSANSLASDRYLHGLTATERLIPSRIRPTMDGGSVICGSLSVFPPYGFVARLDSQGGLVWSRAYGDGVSSAVLSSIVETPTGELLAVGRLGGATSDGWFLRLDAHGGRIGEVRYGLAADERFVSIEPVIGSPGGKFYWVTGDTTEAAWTFGFGSPLVLKVSESGSIALGRTYPNASSSRFSAAAAPTADGGLIVAGSADPVNPTAGANNGFIMRIESSGNVRFMNGLITAEVVSILGLSYHSVAMNGSLAEYIGFSGGLSNFANVTSRSLIGVLKGNGAAIWQLALASPSSNLPSFLDVDFDPASGDPIAVGWIGLPFSQGGPDAHAARFDLTTGNPVWQTCLGGSLTDEFVCLSAQGSNPLIAGFSASLPFANPAGSVVVESCNRKTGNLSPLDCPNIRLIAPSFQDPMIAVVPQTVGMISVNQSKSTVTPIGKPQVMLTPICGGL